jgi:hypothetical protein
MSIFPKRTIPGKGITIHWNFNTSHLKNTHIFPFVRMGVKDPEGEVTLLFEGNILALPQSQEPKLNEQSSKPHYKYLNKNTPLLVLADYLSGPHKREVIVDILSAIQSGRHYYFHFAIPEDAALGKYSLISEVHSNGEIRYSKTAADDFFFVEKLVVHSIAQNENGYIASVSNASPEVIPVKVMECFYNEYEELTTTTVVFELQKHCVSQIEFKSASTFLFYNEEREVLSLCPDSTVFPLRNQQLLSLSKKESEKEVVYVIPVTHDESFKLEDIAHKIWQQADGISGKKNYTDNAYQEAYSELLKSGLIKEVNYK